MILDDALISEVVLNTKPGEFCIALSGMSGNEHPIPFFLGVMNPAALDVILSALSLARRQRPSEVAFREMHEQLANVRYTINRSPS